MNYKIKAEAKSAHAMGVVVPWDFHTGKMIQQRVKRKAGYGHIGYSLGTGRFSKLQNSKSKAGFELQFGVV